MATVTMVLPIPGGIAPDGSGTGNNPATPELVTSSGTQTTNTPKLHFVRLNFDQSTDEHWLWQFILPGDYSSGGELLLKWGAAVTSGNVVWKAGVEANASDWDAAVFNAADVASASAVPATLGAITGDVITLTMTGATANEPIVIFMGRDADNASDTAAGDAWLLAVNFRYTSA